jgi:hypothetical protein
MLAIHSILPDTHVTNLPVEMVNLISCGKYKGRPLLIGALQAYPKCRRKAA